MSSAQVIAPMDSAAVKPRRGFSSIKTIFSNSSSKRHTIAHPIPTNSSSTSLDDTAAGSTSPSSPVSSSAEEEEQETSSSTKRMSSIFTASPQRKQRQLEKAAEKAAEKEKKDQEKQAIQLFSVDEHGAFVPPTPLEKGYRDHFVDNNEDYFNTIISTPPERVPVRLNWVSCILSTVVTFAGRGSRSDDGRR
ncbi:hypothetical protein BGW38_008938 [Lunasporangiospora selenospora]|uniref:Uncharacterized protein n=1 Tax=Lunasporangiospora selenospora TaxID=979761 RepID=A0A9P6FYB7_9FUNG|nr:hypothetical protein BGW38_008938 [Lunasporangiospora selenospora]